MRPLLVGELNPYGADPRAALWPAPVNSSGWRLCVRILQMPVSLYLRSFDRKNLCEGSWNLSEAKKNANEILATHTAPLILLGAKVCEAFGVGYQPFAIQTSLLGPDHEVLVLPHPSGRCFAWNDSSSGVRARTMVSKMLEKK